MSFFEELKRRNVFRVGVAYVIAAWVLLQFADLVLGNIDAPGWVIKVFMLALGFPLTLFFARVVEMTPEGIKIDLDNPFVTNDTVKFRLGNRKSKHPQRRALDELIFDRSTREPGAGFPVHNVYGTRKVYYRADARF